MRKITPPKILPQIEALSTMVGDRLGLDFPERKWDMLQRVVDELATEHDCLNSQIFLDELLSSPLSEERLNQLIVRLTVGETYFLRDKEVFTVLNNYILPDVIKKRSNEKRLDFWCAASSTGEEPYSIAMLLDEKAKQLKDWHINIQASDLNLDVLDIARKGIYSNWSLRATPEDKKKQYFTPIDKNRFSLAPHIREMVNFSQLNLAQDEFVMPGVGGRLADIIFCRNVLIYFSAKLQAQVIKRLTALLQPGGWLLVAPSELGMVNESALKIVNFPGVMVHQKNDTLVVPGRQPFASVYSKSAVRRKQLDVFCGQKCNLSAGKSGVAVSPSDEKELKQNLLSKADFLQSRRKQVEFCRSQSVSLSTLQKANEFFSQHSYREVIDLIPEGFETVVGEERDYPEIMALKARALANLGEIEEAAATIFLALEADKVNPFYYYLAATVKRELADYDAALDLYRQALFLDPDFVMAHFSLATLLKHLKRKGVERHLRNVKKLLEKLEENADVPHGEGLTAGRLLEITSTLALS